MKLLRTKQPTNSVRPNELLGIFPGKAGYFGLFYLSAVVVMMLCATDLAVAPHSMLAPFKTISLSVLAVSLVRLLERRNALEGLPGWVRERGRILLEGLLFITLAWVAVRLFNHLSMNLPVPYADVFLAKVDDALGLDWYSYFTWIAEREWLVVLLDYAYTSLTPLSVVIFSSLVVLGYLEDSRGFVLALFFASVVASAIGGFFPAEAAVRYHSVPESILRSFPTTPGVYHLPYLHRLRAESGSVISLTDLPGLTTFPSFHTAAGLLVAWYSRHTVLAVPMVVYCGIMLFSIPVYGGHYFVDMIGGALLAWLSVYTASRISRNLVV